MEGRKGKLKPGFLADIVILNTDIEAVAPDQIMETVRAAVTICDGKITYRAQQQA
jgi:predicted amidohydrolase YtcJ